MLHTYSVCPAAPEDLQQLLHKLGAAATTTTSAKGAGTSGGQRIQVSELLTLASQDSAQAPEPVGPEVTQIHTK